MSHVCLSKILPTEFQRAPRTAMKRKGETKSHAFGAAKLGEKRTKRTRWKKKRFPQPLGGVAFLKTWLGYERKARYGPLLQRLSKPSSCAPMPAHCQPVWLSGLPRKKGPESNALRGSNGRRHFTAAAPRKSSQRICPSHLQDIDNAARPPGV